MVRYSLATLAALTLVATALVATPPAMAADYAVVVSQKTIADDQWLPVVDKLRETHDATLYTFKKDPSEALPLLREAHPRYTCFVMQPTEATRDAVAKVHQLTRAYDDDPYTDTRWGILTGYDAANALAIASHREPLTVSKVGSGTEIATDMVVQTVCYDELVKNKRVRKEAQGEAIEEKGPADTTASLVGLLNDYQADLFVTSGHATERNWQIGFRYKNGYFKSKDGQMIGQDTKGEVLEIDSPNPKVYLPIGNCLMGHIDGPDAMALAWMNDAGVHQMIGYTVPTWFGYAGWGCLDYFVEQPGRYTLNEAFLANHHALVHKLQTIGPQDRDRRGLAFDRDVLAFYGDPAWEARMADLPKAFDQELTANGDLYTLRITPRRGAVSFEPINTNGSQRGWRPFVAYLPHRVREVRIIKGADLQPVVTDDFVLVPNPRECDEGRAYEVVFKAKRMAAGE